MTHAIPRTGLRIKIHRGLPVRKEKDFQAEVVKVARLFGYLCHHQYDARKSEPGVPDLLIVGHGRCIHAELKRQGGRYTPAQRMWLAALLGAPCEVYTFVDGVNDMREIAEILNPSRGA